MNDTCVAAAPSELNARSLEREGRWVASGRRPKNLGWGFVVSSNVCLRGVVNMQRSWRFTKLGLGNVLRKTTRQSIFKQPLMVWESDASAEECKAMSYSTLIRSPHP